MEPAPLPYEVDLARLTLRQYLALRHNLFRPADLARLTRIPKPRASELLRGLEVYPAALRAVREFLGARVDDDLFAALLENARERDGKLVA